LKNYNEIPEIIKIQGARQHFWLFCLYIDFEFFSKRKFLKQVAILYQLVIDKYLSDVAIKVGVSMPPRAGKSYITSLFASYWLGIFPDLSVMRNTCTATLYQKFSYDTRNIVKTSKYRSIFPNVELSDDKKNLDGWNLKTAKQVSYFGAGVGGTIIGFGANLAITDDLYKGMTDALSTTKNDAVKMWKTSAHDSRFEKNCPEIYIGTRWTKNDVIGDAIDNKYFYDYIKIPALVNNESFCTDVKSTDEYLTIKQRSPKHVWEAEYMQNPLTVEGLLIPFDTISFLTQKYSSEYIPFKFAIIDPADTGGDKFSMPIIDVIVINNNIKCYVRDVIHSTTGIEASVNRAYEKLCYNNIDIVLCEQNGLGLAAIKLLNNKIISSNKKLVPFTSKINKDIRIYSHYEFIQQFFVFNNDKYENDPEYNEFITDLTSFVKGGDNKHIADAIDVLATAANVIKAKYKDILFR